jgi:protein-disulfide isomerase
MKNNSETKLLAIMAVVVALGGAFLLFSNKNVTEPTPVSTPIPKKPWTVAEFDAVFKSATHIRGNDKSPLKIIEFADAQCPSCRRTFDIFAHKFGKEIDANFAFMHYPIHGEHDLPMHEHAIPAIVAMEAAGNQNKFWEMQEALFTKQESEKGIGGEPDLSDAFIQKQAQTIGLNMEQFNKDIKEPALTKNANETATFASGKGINVTPSFLYLYKGKVEVAGGSTELVEQLKGYPGLPTPEELKGNTGTPKPVLAPPGL